MEQVSGKESRGRKEEEGLSTPKLSNFVLEAGYCPPFFLRENLACSSLPLNRLLLRKELAGSSPPLKRIVVASIDREMNGLI